MQIFMLDTDCNKYQNLTLVNNDWEKLWEFTGYKLEPTWNPVKVEVIIEKKKDLLRPASDCPNLSSHVPVFSARAVDCLRDILEPNGEILSLDCKDGEYYAFNVTTLLDILDEDNSEIDYFDDNIRIMHIEKFHFSKAPAKGQEIFKLPQDLLGSVFVTENFINRVSECGLVGFKFRDLTQIVH